MAKENITPSQKKNSDEDEIDLIALVKTLWEGRKTVLRTTVIFMAIGLFIAIFTPKEFTASTTMVPQGANGGSNVSGKLGGFAALAGINLGGMSNESVISPTLYPQIIGSVSFQKELLQTPLTIKGQSEPISFEKYYSDIYRPGLLSYLKKYTIGLPGVIIKAIKPIPTNNQQPKSESLILSISQKENELLKILENQIVLNVNDKDGYLSLSANMPQALPSAELTKAAQELLQKYIIDFKIKKSKEQLQFIQERYTEKEKEFRTTQVKLANFRDRNRNINSALAQTRLERLKSEYDLAYGVFLELAKQLESQQIQVKEDTPVFTVLKQVTVPIEKSKPSRLLILIIWIFVGSIVGISIVFGRDFVLYTKEKWNE